MAIIPLAFMTVVTDSYGEPQLSFANQGDKCIIFSGTALFYCSELEEDITTCQETYGKTIILSIGGATYTEGGFNSVSEAQSAAELVWATFGPEQNNKTTSEGTRVYRPFGSASIDGFDFDFESSVSNMAPFAQALRELMDESEAEDGKHRILTAAPQCPYPDASDDQFLSGVSAVKMDAIFVQFYNNYCGMQSFISSSSTQNNFNYDTWDSWARSSANPAVKVFIGVPASSTAASSGYVSLPDLEPIIDYCRDFATFGGIMMWDASQAYANSGFLPGVKSYLISSAALTSNSTVPTPVTQSIAGATVQSSAISSYLEPSVELKSTTSDISTLMSITLTAVMSNPPGITLSADVTSEASESTILASSTVPAPMQAFSRQLNSTAATTHPITTTTSSQEPNANGITITSGTNRVSSKQLEQLQ
ncbi:endo-1,3-beta glucanase [Botryosphaeria dothidea]